jgi:hypothetical protein
MQVRVLPGRLDHLGKARVEEHRVWAAEARGRSTLPRPIIVARAFIQRMAPSAVTGDQKIVASVLLSEAAADFRNGYDQLSV